MVVETGAGEGSSFQDEAYAAAGATIVLHAESVFERAELLLKVKEPLEQEYLRLHNGHVLFTYLHLAPNPVLTRGLLESGATCLAYETVESPEGALPLLAPVLVMTYVTPLMPVKLKENWAGHHKKPLKLA